MRRATLASLLALAALAACGDRGRQEQVFDGHAFRADLDAQREDPRVFTVAVSPAAASLQGAREAGRYEATVHCLQTVGISDVEWRIGPDSPAEALPIREGRLILSGRCSG